MGSPTLMDRDLLNECVHCGFCLPTCPTWTLWNEEMDTPRGRIYLMERLVEGDELDLGRWSHSTSIAASAAWPA